MANFLAVLDASAERRSRCAEEALPRLRIIPDLRTGQATVGDLSVSWAAGSNAPVGVWSEPDESGLAVVWGHGFPRGGARPVQARGLTRENWRTTDGPRCFDGFHAWIVSDRRGHLEVGADPLGLFPIYWTRLGSEGLLVGSAPGSFCAHPSFHPRLDNRGLATLLLTNGLVDGRCLLEGVRRLPPGHRLVRDAEGGVRELCDYMPGPAEDLSDQLRSELLDRIDSALESSVARMLAPWTSPGMLLSGGLDSRALAGYAARSGRLRHAVTFGKPTDQEYRVAVSVARTLGVEHRRVDHRDDDFALAAHLEASQAWLSNGFSSLHHWSVPLQSAPMPEASLTGLVGDAVLSLTPAKWASEKPGETGVSLDAFVRNLGVWGVPRPIIAAFATDWFRQLLDETGSGLPGRFPLGEGSTTRQVWRAFLATRQRYHAGASPGACPSRAGPSFRSMTAGSWTCVRRFPSLPWTAG